MARIDGAREGLWLDGPPAQDYHARMTANVPPASPSKPSREREREALLEEAMRRPGVAETIRAYRDLQKYQVPGRQIPVKPQYATGANT